MVGQVQREIEVFKSHLSSENGEEELDYLIRLEEIVLKRDSHLKAEIEAKVRLAGLVIGHPENKIVKESIAPKIEYWHHRSGRHVDFVFLGFSRDEWDNLDGKAFNKIVSLFEHEFKWKYSGETDLILLNVRYDSSNRLAVLDTSEVVVLTLEHAIETKAISGVSSFIEDIIDITKDYKGNNPVWHVSDQQGGRLAGSSIMRFLMSLLPQAIREDAQNAFRFYVKDLSRRNRKNPSTEESSTPNVAKFDFDDDHPFRRRPPPYL